jgi:MipA family protein
MCWPPHLRPPAAEQALVCAARPCILAACVLFVALMVPGAAWAQETALDERPADAPPRWTAAAGFAVSAGPAVAGDSRIAVRVQPGLALRWGRLSVSSRSAFAPRDGDVGARAGLRLELLRSERWRSSLGLRWDKGRSEDSDVKLSGLGNVRSTLRARLALGLRLDKGWRAGLALTADLLGRGGGLQAGASLGRDVAVSSRTGLGGTLTLNMADARYMRSWYGVTPEQSAASGYVIYTPGAGLRDLGLAVGGRTELDARWALFYGGSVSRLLGPAAASPWVSGRLNWGLSAGLVLRLF